MTSKQERPVKRLRRLSTEYDDSEEADDWTPSQEPETKDESRKSSHGAFGGTDSLQANSTRSRRGVATPLTASAPTKKSIESSPEFKTRSIHLTLKAPPSKLREVTGGSRNISVNSRDSFEGGKIISGPRGSRNKKPIVEESSEDDEDEAQPEVDEDEDDDMEDDEDAEGEDEDAEGEEEDEGPPPPLVHTVQRPGHNPKLTVTPAKDAARSVEAKEMRMDDDDDDELSELDSPEDDTMGGMGDEEDEDLDEDAESEDEDSDPEIVSRGDTPDLSKLTRRQRAAYEQHDGGLMALSNEAQKKKHLTAEEHAMRRAEMARRRKNLSEKRNEEEKMETINKLLKKQAPKRRGRAMVDEVAADSPSAQEPEVERPQPIYVRHVQNSLGNRVGVPEEWLGSPVGAVFEGTRPVRHELGGMSGKLVQEIEG